MCVILCWAAVSFGSITIIISNMEVGQAGRWKGVLIGEVGLNENVKITIRTICT